MANQFRMDFVGTEVTQHMSAPEKIDLLMQKILDNVIVVLQDDLAPEERAELIKQVMLRIDRTFFGVELISLRHMDKKTRFWQKKEDPSFTVIAPSNLVEIVSQDRNRLCLLLGSCSCF